MKVGFAGSREGVTEAQAECILAMLRLLHRDEHDEFCHGDCVGADVAAARLARGVGYWICARPPLYDRYREKEFRSDFYFPPKEYLTRNRDIVDGADVVIAAPNSRIEYLRGGTWSTVRYARRRKSRLAVVYPDGGCSVSVDGVSTREIKDADSLVCGLAKILQPNPVGGDVL